MVEILTDTLASGPTLGDRADDRSDLAELFDRLRRASAPERVLTDANRFLGERLNALRVGYGEIDPDQRTLTLLADWTDGVPSNAGVFPLDSFGPEIVAANRAGRTFVSKDIRADPRISEAHLEAFTRWGIGALVAAPLVKDGRFTAILSVQAKGARDWTDGEVATIDAVAERTWEALERSRAEARLRKSEERLRVALDGAGMGTWDYDLTTMAGWWSERTCEIFGVPYAEVIPPELRFSLVHPDDLDRYLREVDEAALAGQPFSIEYRVVRPGGDVRWVMLRGVVTTDDAGVPVRATGVALDTTDRRAAEAELERSRAALIQGEKIAALGLLLAGVAHELNNPLAVVVAQAELLAEEAAETPFAEDARTIRRAADRCARIVRTFLAMARERTPERSRVEVEGLVRSALELSDYGLRTSGITVDAYVAPDLLPIMGDESQLQQVLANLLVNAQHAMLERPGDRRLTITARESGPGAVTLDVTDTGGGVPPEHRSRVFEPFYTTKPPGAGTGIGLSFSLGVARAHGGDLELLSTSAEGTTFRLTLPASTRTEGVAAPSAAERTPTPGRKRALVIDDEPEIAGLLARLLEKEGFSVESAASGRAACALLAATDFHLILSDIRMPDLDGAGLFEWIEANRPELAERTGFVTGDTMSTSSARFLAHSRRPFVEKPFDAASVRGLLRTLEAGR